jgi:hypothetical protein
LCELLHFQFTFQTLRYLCRRHPGTPKNDSLNVVAVVLAKMHAISIWLVRDNSDSSDNRTALTLPRLIAALPSSMRIAVSVNGSDATSFIQNRFIYLCTTSVLRIGALASRILRRLVGLLF